ncbi:hypothetical protein DES36_11953 [Alkalibaculum bacchi]|uniref:Uncharacterized protein n=1 Tax=Alkalibaculum bacchi TaxID=645887 RepID=A0A366I1K2_9FIRM|nr:MobP2 family relaxase [Alkalibaculum bacchi]RBP59328.1 hypothetical protein DES36_11953 [Alkalibaculum bacchi]
MGSPSVILTSQFTVPTAKSFTKYVSYMTRKDALLEKEESLSNEEQQELKRIENTLETFKVEKGKSYRTLNNKKDLTTKEQEANNILKEKDSFSDVSDYEKYIRYMTRQYALEKKNKLTVEEQKVLKVVKKKLSDIVKEEVKEEVKEQDVKLGVFSINKEIMTVEDIKDANKIISNAEKNGSVFYQDVISFDREFLEKEGIYNSKTNELDEEKIQYASRQMMKQMFKDENIENGYWFASIHRNTKHIHIHYGTVEYYNTRPLRIIETEDGEEYLAPKGKRKQSTIDNMKSTFANALIDRTSELSRISELRNTLVQDIKETYSRDKKAIQQTTLFNEIYNELPSNKKYWQYGSKKISDNTREKIDRLTDLLMNDNEDYKEYIRNIKEEDKYRKELFGDSKRDEKNYANNKVDEIHKRLGNSLLKEMKNKDNNVKRNRSIYRHGTGGEEKRLQQYETFNKPIIKRKDIYRIKCALSDDYDKYRAERDYEYIQQKIAWEQQKNEL